MNDNETPFLESRSDTDIDNYRSYYVKLCGINDLLNFRV